MTTPSVRVSFVLPVSAARLYRAWLDAKEHAAFTGAGATSSPKVGGKWSAFDGYARGKYLELCPVERLVFSFHAADFPEGAGDSTVEVLLQPASGGTRVTILHAGLPPGSEERFRKGWRRHYAAPMRDYFHVGHVGADVGAAVEAAAGVQDPNAEGAPRRRGRGAATRAAAARPRLPSGRAPASKPRSG